MEVVTMSLPLLPIYEQILKIPAAFTLKPNLSFYEKYVTWLMA